MTSFWLLHADADLMSDVATLAGFVTGAFFVLELSVTSCAQLHLLPCDSCSTSLLIGLEGLTALF